ncbi:MAG: hypothetical protein R2830_09280 [Saprospiraceae bacterium]
MACPFFCGPANFPHFKRAPLAAMLKLVDEKTKSCRRQNFPTSTGRRQNQGRHRCQNLRIGRPRTEFDGFKLGKMALPIFVFKPIDQPVIGSQDVLVAIIVQVNNINGLGTSGRSVNGVAVKMLAQERLGGKKTAGYGRGIGVNTT